jgi:hypothetical protein
MAAVSRLVAKFRGNFGVYLIFPQKGDDPSLTKGKNP